MPKTFALLVGINAYPHPISSLGGCLKDIEQIATYLKKSFVVTDATIQKKEALIIEQYEELQICQLLDEQATHVNIHKGFEQFLQQAGEEDVVWFHFSGHGAEQRTLPEFLPIEPTGKDQTLVCYKKETTDYLHLPDKELAILLHKVANFDEKGQVKNSPHIVVSLDCCHSGSGTRDFWEDPKLKSRDLFSASRGEEMNLMDTRDWATFAGGFYKKAKEEENKLEIPLTKHLLISACESVQLAGDLPSGGVFTTGLVNALKNTNGEINYADLFIKTRAAAQQIRKDQLPQFEPIGSFDPYTQFLKGTALGSPDRYEIIKEGDQLFVKCGAIHGLSLNAKELKVLKIGSDDSESWAGELVSVGAQKSEFKLADKQLTGELTDYQAIIPNFLADPVLVGLTGTTPAIDALKAAWDTSKNVKWTADSSTKVDWAMEVIAKDGRYFIQDHSGKQKGVTWNQTTPESAVTVMSFLNKMAKWNRTLLLNKQPTSKILDWVDFKVGIIDKDNKKTIQPTSTIELKEADGKLIPLGGNKVGIGLQPQVTIKNTTQDLYCYLLIFRTNSSITSDESVMVYRPDEHTGMPTIPLTKAPIGWGLGADDKEGLIWLKLIVTTEPLDHFQLLQSGLMGDKDVVFRWNPVKVSDEWFSKTIAIKMSRD